MKKITRLPEPIECDKCGCEFTFDDQDIYVTALRRPSWLFGLPVNRECRVVKCPICGEELVLKWF